MSVDSAMLRILLAAGTNHCIQIEGASYKGRQSDRSLVIRGLDRIFFRSRLPRSIVIE